MTPIEWFVAIIIFFVLGSLFYTAYNNTRDRARMGGSEINKCRTSCAKDLSNNLSDCLIRCSIINYNK